MATPKHAWSLCQYIWSEDLKCFEFPDVHFFITGKKKEEEWIWKQQVQLSPSFLELFIWSFSNASIKTARIVIDVQSITFCHIKSGCLVTGNQAQSQEILAPFIKGLLKLNISIFPCYVPECMVASVMGLSEKFQAVIPRIVLTK